MSDLSSWDSTEEEDEIPLPVSNQQLSLGMKHSEGMMDLSKVLSEEPRQEEKIPNEHLVVAKREDMDEERIYDSVENLLSEDQGSVPKMLGKEKYTTTKGDNNQKPFAEHQGLIEMKNNRLSHNHLRDNLSPPSNGYIGEFAVESNINPDTNSPQYEKILRQPQDEFEANNASDWDSPPLSDNKEMAIPKRVLPFMNIKTGESTSASGRNQTRLIDPDSNIHILKQPVAQFDKLSSPSLKKFKECSDDDNDAIARASGDNQPYSSLPPDATKPEINLQLSNKNRYEGLNKITFFNSCLK